MYIGSSIESCYLIQKKEYLFNIMSNKYGEPLNHDQKAKVFTSIWMTHKPRMNFYKYVCVTYTVFRTINQQEERDMHVENEALYYITVDWWY